MKSALCLAIALVVLPAGAARATAATDVNAREADGTTALHWAARADDVEMVRTHLTEKRLLRSRPWPLRQVAVLNGN